MAAIILAGGKGTRINHLISDVPKPLVDVAGAPFLHWVSRWAEAQGERRHILSAFHLAEKIRVWAKAEARQRPQCEFSVCVEPQPLGTGGAVIYAARYVADDTYLVLNGDSLVFASLKPTYRRLASSPKLDGIIVGLEVDDAARFGSLDIDGTGLLKGFREKQSGAALVNAGVYLLRRKLLEGTPERTSIEYDLFPHWLAGGARIGVATTDAPFLDIGTPESLAAAAAFIDANKVALDMPDAMVPVRVVD